MHKLIACTAYWGWKQSHAKSRTAHEDRERIYFVFAFACVVGKNPNTPKLSPIADDAITRGSIRSLVSPLYICDTLIEWSCLYLLNIVFYIYSKASFKYCFFTFTVKLCEVTPQVCPCVHICDKNLCAKLKTKLLYNKAQFYQLKSVFPKLIHGTWP